MPGGCCFTSTLVKYGWGWLHLVASSILALVTTGEKREKLFSGSMGRPQKFFPVFRVMTANNQTIFKPDIITKKNLPNLRGFTAKRLPQLIAVVFSDFFAGLNSSKPMKQQNSQQRLQRRE